MNNIRQLRKGLSLTQRELANLCNISQGALSGYETGKFEPDTTTLKALADIFGVSIDDILGYDKQQPGHASTTDDAIMPKVTDVSPHTTEAKILSAGIDKMPARDRERALRMVRLMFDQYEEYFRDEEECDDDDS